MSMWDFSRCSWENTGDMGNSACRSCGNGGNFLRFYCEDAMGAGHTTKNMRRIGGCLSVQIFQLDLRELVRIEASEGPKALCRLEPYLDISGYLPDKLRINKRAAKTIGSTKYPGQ